MQRQAEAQAEEKLLDLLLPGTAQGSSREATREKLRKLWQLGHLNEHEVEVEITEQAPQLDMFAIPGSDNNSIGSQMKSMMSRFMPPKTTKKRLNTKAAYDVLVQQAKESMLDQDRIEEAAKKRVEQSGIIFIDEIDKIASSSQQRSSDISREGVQRDLLPIVEGCVVNTKYGMVHTDHILFIAAGAFHFSKPSDLIPELQGRFPLRVELQALGREEFYRILTEPHNSLQKQYRALLETESVELDFTEDGLREIAVCAEQANERSENIGARRLYTILEKILAEISFEAPERQGQRVVVNREYVKERLDVVMNDVDLQQFIL